MDTLPSFDRDPNHAFLRGEVVYVIDPNDYDIWEACVVKITDRRYCVSYKDNACDDEWVDKRRVLAKNVVNFEIFEEQERIRRSKQFSEIEFLSDSPDRTGEENEVSGDEDISQDWNNIGPYLPQLREILRKCTRHNVEPDHLDLLDSASPS
jgi:hypothetical protein